MGTSPELQGERQHLHPVLQLSLDNDNSSDRPSVTSPFAQDDAQQETPPATNSSPTHNQMSPNALISDPPSWDSTGKPVLVSLSSSSSMPNTLTSGHEWAQSAIPDATAPNTLTSGHTYGRLSSFRRVSSSEYSESEDDADSESSDGYGGDGEVFIQEDVNHQTLEESAVVLEYQSTSKQEDNLPSNSSVADMARRLSQMLETGQEAVPASAAAVAEVAAVTEVAAPAEAAPQMTFARQPLLSSFDLAGVAELIKSGKARKIVCACGAGISVSAGIPDFRTPGTGLYSQLAKYNLPAPEAVFQLEFFLNNPHPFYMLAKELFPGNYQPTPTHYFMKLLHDKGLLLRCFTQNIDSLEAAAGLPREAVVAAHGNFDAAHCTECDKEHTIHKMREHINSNKILKCSCGGLVKPRIVFYGESLPEEFVRRLDVDTNACDLLIVMGTSLVVYPFANIVGFVQEDCPRLLINREVVGQGEFDFSERNYRDALFLGNCDEGVRQLAMLLGWEQELQSLVEAGAHAQQRAAASCPCCWG